MPARITVRAELQSLLDQSQALTDANRLKQLEAEARRRAELDQLAAKRAKQADEDTRRKQQADPTMGTRRTAAMGQQATTKFSGYFMKEFETDAVRLSVRSGVKATAPTIFYADVIDSGYANQSTVTTFPRASALDFTVFSLENCPEYASVIAEATPLLGFVDVLGSDDSWYIGAGWYRLLFPLLSIDSYAYYDTVLNASGFPTILQHKSRDVSQVGSTDPAYRDIVEDFSFTSYKAQDGATLPRGRFIYAEGYRNSKSYAPGNFTGYVTELDQTWALVSGALVNTVTRNVVIPARGGWGGASSSAGPTTAAWIVAESANVPSGQSLVETGVGALNLEQAFAGNFSSWPGAPTGGQMTQLFPPGGGGGGGGGGGE
jgi:hypothetical protein